MKTATATKPKLGFAGVGWIGMNRLKAIQKKGTAEIKTAVDPDISAIEEVEQTIANFQPFRSFDAMLDQKIDGVVIATPSALHAEQAIKALNKGKAVFCQKPLGRNKQETAEVVETARRENLLLSVDFSYRFTEAAKAVKKVISSGELGKIYGVHLTFHNAYGPDKAWYYDKILSGGGCLMDLGIHLIDLLFWTLDEREIYNLSSQKFHKGQRLKEDNQLVEDYVAAQFCTGSDTSVQLSCSWNLPAGKDAIIEASFYGENGGVSFRNVEGSFFDFVAERYTGTSTEILAEPPDDWSGRAAVEWSKKLTNENRFDPEAESYVDVARTLDMIYQD